MGSVLFVFVIAVVLLVLIIALKKGFGSVSLPYLREPHLFTPAERAFLAVLDEAVGEQYRIFGKVRVADLARVKPGLSKSRRQTALNWVAQKHVDYVVCKRSDLSVVCVIELNDKSHKSRSVATRDRFLKEVCDVIELPLLQTPAKKSYSAAELRAEFFASINRV